MAIKGSLKEASLPDVLQLLAMGKKTGCLAVTHRNNFGYIYFDKGRICYASIVNRRDRLGDILVKAGSITQAQLDAAIAGQGAHRDKRLGELLIAQGALKRDELHDRIRSQIEEAVYFLFTWSQGTFSFEADVRPDEQDLLVSINPDALLLEGARRVDEWSLIEKKVPSFDVVFDVDRRRLDESDVTLTPEQGLLVGLVDGRRDVTALVDESGLGEFDVGKALYGLATAGFLHRIGQTKRTDPVGSDTRVTEHRNLGVAFYKTGMLDEAVREFRRVLELREQDGPARFHVGLVLLRQGKWADAANAFHEAASRPGAKASFFHNLAYALERLGRYDEAQAALEEARALYEEAGAAWTLGRTHNALAWIAWRKGDLARAERLFRDSIRILKTLQERASLCESQRGLAQLLAAEGKLDEAERYALEARETVGAHDQSSRATTRMALAIVRAGQGRDAEAEELFRESLEVVGRTEFGYIRFELLGAYGRFLRERGRTDEAQALEDEVADLGTVTWGQPQPEAATARMV